MLIKLHSFTAQDDETFVSRALPQQNMQFGASRESMFSLQKINMIFIQVRWQCLTSEKLKEIF